MPWRKLYRCELLRRHGLRFAEGEEVLGNFKGMGDWDEALVVGLARAGVPVRVEVPVDAGWKACTVGKSLGRVDGGGDITAGPVGGTRPSLSRSGCGLIACTALAPIVVPTRRSGRGWIRGCGG